MGCVVSGLSGSFGHSTLVWGLSGSSGHSTLVSGLSGSSGHSTLLVSGLSGSSGHSTLVSGLSGSSGHSTLVSGLSGSSGHSTLVSGLSGSSGHSILVSGLSGSSRHSTLVSGLSGGSRTVGILRTLYCSFRTVRILRTLYCSFRTVRILRTLCVVPFLGWSFQDSQVDPGLLSWIGLLGGLQTILGNLGHVYGITCCSYAITGRTGHHVKELKIRNLRTFFLSHCLESLICVLWRNRLENRFLFFHDIQHGPLNGWQAIVPSWKHQEEEEEGRRRWVDSSITCTAVQTVAIAHTKL